MVCIGGWRSGGFRRGGGYRGGPYGNPYGGYRRGGGGSCLRDACLLEGGCCLGEALTGNCLVLATLIAPQLLQAFVMGTANTSRHGGTGTRLAGGLTATIRVYQVEISARLSGRCRFTPSCSQFAVEALETHGAGRGIQLALGRLLRCRPGGARGADHVPAASSALSRVPERMVTPR